jgi:hypothetical protein
MDMVLLVVGIVLVTILVALYVSYLLGLWEPAALESPDIEGMINNYDIPSAWTAAKPINGDECKAYTFIGTNSTVPQPSLNKLNAGVNSNTVKELPITSACVDDDQIFAQKKFHICRYGELQDIPLEQFAGCPLINGGFTKIDGYYEEFFSVCTPTPDTSSSSTGASSSVTSDNSSRCKGSVGLITYGFTASITTAKCMKEPVFTMDGETAIIDPEAPLRTTFNIVVGTNPPINILDKCDISTVTHRMPNQLFRMTRYIYDTVTPLKQNQQGSWVSIEHRQTQKMVAPYTLGSDSKTPSVLSFDHLKPVILVDRSSFGNGLGNWWYITPRLTQPLTQIRNFPKPPGWTLFTAPFFNPAWNPSSSSYDGLIWSDEAQIALPQIIWAPDPTVIGPLSDNDTLWNYFTDPDNKIYSMVPFVLDGADLPLYSGMRMIEFLTYNPSSPTEGGAGILSPNDPASPYYPSLTDAGAPGGYVDTNKNNTSSSCNNYSLGSIENLQPVFGVFFSNFFSPLAENSPCYREYKTALLKEYTDLIVGQKKRVVAEAGTFQFIDLSLYPLMLNNSDDFGF